MKKGREPELAPLGGDEEEPQNGSTPMISCIRS